MAIPSTWLFGVGYVSLSVSFYNFFDGIPFSPLVRANVS